MKPTPSLLLQLALLGSLPASAADLYWNRTTTAGWTTSNWGTVSGGPYTSAWASGSDVIFEDNGGTPLLITGATTNVASITANENVTVTAGGTLTLAGPINVADGKTLNFQGQVLSGSGIEKTGLGNLDLNASNSFTGGFAIRGGTVLVRNANALGGGSVTLGATSGSDFATLRVPTITFARSIILETGTIGALAIASLGGNATSVYTGGVTGTNNLNIRSVVGGAGTATARFTTGSINHVGSLTLANTGNGTSTSAVGVIDIQSAIGSNVTDLTISNLTTGTRGLQRVFIRNSNNAYTGNTTIDAGAILILQGSNVIPDGAGKGNVEVNGTLDMRGATETINGLSGTGTLRIGGSISETTLTVGGNDASASFGGTIEDGSGTSVSFAKTGSGNQTLSATNTYTGTTSVNAGTLVVNGGLTGTSGVTVASLATLGGIGNINTSALVTVNGTLSPGNSAGTLSLGSLALASTATFDYEFGLSASDMVEVAGSLGLGGATLDLTDLATGTLDIGDSLTLFAYDGLWDTTTFSGLADDSTFTSTGYEWLIDYNSSTPGSLNGGSANSYVTLTVIPEPGAALLGGMGILLLLRRRR